MLKSTTLSMFQCLWGRKFFRFFIQLVILCAVASLIESVPRVLEKCGRRISSRERIVGGTLTKPGEYPWVVSIHEEESFTHRFAHYCGGSILNEHYIITAAHCLSKYPNDPSKYQIYTGVHQLSKKKMEPAKMYEIVQLIVHKDFDRMTFENDIALLRTKEPMKIEGTSRYVNSICLPHDDDDPSGWAFVSGWGRTKEGGKTSDTLRVVKIPLVPRNLCGLSYGANTYYNFTIFDSQICAGIIGKDSCRLDSGGPLMQRNKKGIYTIIGIVSFGEGCARQKFPGVYTKVASFMDWLEENMD